MIDFKTISPARSNLTEEWLLKQISPSAIFFLYHGAFKIGRVYNSLFRKDAKPSCGFFIHQRTGALLYSDFVTGHKMNCIQFVMRLFNLKYYDAIEKIAQDFGLVKGNKIISDTFLKDSSEIEDEIKKNEVLIQWRARPHTKKDLEYWAQYEITQKELNDNYIYSVGELFLNKKEIKNYNDEPRFAYPLMTDDGLKVKIYSPQSEKMKWLSSIPNNKPFGINKLRYESDTVIITKSKKDEIVLKKIFSDVISLQNESEQALDKEDAWLLENHFNRRVVVFDADPPGVNACKKFNIKGYDYFNTPKSDYEKYGITDPSDYIKIYGLEMLKEEFYKKGIFN